MKKKIFLLVLFAAFAAACSDNEDENANQSVQDLLLTPPTVNAAISYNLIGKVTCKICKPASEMWVEVKDGSDTDFLTSATPSWKGAFNNGEFKVVALMFPGSTYVVRLSVEKVCEAGCPLYRFVAPANNSEPILLNMTID